MELMDISSFWDYFRFNFKADNYYLRGEPWSSNNSNENGNLPLYIDAHDVIIMTCSFVVSPL